MKLIRLILLSFLLISWGCSDSEKEIPVNPPEVPSEIVIDNYTSKDIKNLALLGKVWGFLKYYHPEVASGKYKWDDELLIKIVEVLKTSSDTERNKLLNEWVASLGSIEKTDNYVIPGDDNQIKYRPNLKWIENQAELGDLSTQLITVRNADKQRTSNAYVSLAPNIGNPLFKNELYYNSMNYGNDGIKLVALFRYWNMIEYFFPYKFLADEDWDAVLEEAIPEFIDAENVLAYKLALLKLIGKVQDTHAHLNSDKDLYNYFGENQAPVKIRFAENQVVVVMRTQNEGVKHILEVGDVIKKVDGKDISEWIAQNKPYFPASNEPVQLKNMCNSLLRTNASTIQVEFDRAGQIMTETVQCYPQSQIFPTIPSHKWLSEEIGYIYCASIQNDVDQMMNTFKEAKGIVIDLRCYPSQFVAYSLGAYLVPSPTGFVKFTTGNITYPGLFTYTSVMNVGGGNHYKGKVIVLVNEESVSQSEFTTMAFRKGPNVTVIGSTTAGADGDISEIVLPGNVRTYISGIGVYYPDGGETQRIGIIPDIEVKPTIQGIRENRDEVLERAIMLINGN